MDLFKLVSRMDRGLFENIVVSMTDIGPVGRKIQDCGVPVYALKMKKGFPDPRGVLPFCRFVRYFNPQIIQSWMYHANLLGLLSIRKTKCVWNILCSEVDLTQYGNTYRWAVMAGAYLSQVPHAVVTNSRAGRITHLGLGYRPRSWEIIPNGIDTELFKQDPIAREGVRRKLKIPQDAMVIGLVARLDPLKDHENFFKAAEIILRIDPDIHFILAGRGITPGNPMVRNLMSEIERREKLHLLGEVDEINQVYAALDIASSSSSGEGLPNAIAEAMASGVPCVVTDAGDSRIVVDDTGVVVPIKDPIALAQGWQSLISGGPEAIKGLGELARRRIKEHYNMNSMVLKYENLYTKLCRSARSGERED